MVRPDMPPTPVPLRGGRKPRLREALALPVTTRRGDATAATAAFIGHLGRRHARIAREQRRMLPGVGLRVEVEPPMSIG